MSMTPSPAADPPTSATPQSWGGGGSVREWIGWLSGGFTPCRHLRPSSGREHTSGTAYRQRFLIPSALSNRGASGRGASGGNPPSRIDEAGHTKAFDYPVAEHWGESRNVQFRGWGSNRQHISPESNVLPTEPPGSPRGSHNPGSSTGGIFSQLGG